MSGLKYPSHAIRLEFVDTYLQQLRNECPEVNNNDVQDERNRLLIEAEFYAMVNALFVALLFIQPQEAFLDCDKSRSFMTMASQMLNLFNERKKGLMNNYDKFA